MALVNQDFEIYAGDTKNLVVTVTKSDGTIAPLIGDVTVKWVAVRGKDIVISKDTTNGIAITDDANGEFTVRLDSVDTKTLLGSLKHEAVITDGLGNVSTVMVGTIKVLASYV
jgi:hypothetical protein